MPTRAEQARDKQYKQLFTAFGAVADYPETYRQCRDLTHYWGDEKSEIDTDLEVVYRQVTCFTCKTERYQAYDKFGTVLNTRYLYPKDYKIPVIEDYEGFVNKSFWRGLLYMQMATSAGVPAPAGTSRRRARSS